MIKTNYKLSVWVQRAQKSRFLDVGLEAALDGGVETNSGNLIYLFIYLSIFLNFWFLQMSLVMASNVMVNFLRDFYSNWHERYLYMIFCGDFFEIHIKSFSFRLQPWKKGNFSF